jgi:Zn-dependent M28 family amino/carboxypeptidase
MSKIIQLTQADLAGLLKEAQIAYELEKGKFNNSGELNNSATNTDWADWYANYIFNKHPDKTFDTSKLREQEDKEIIELVDSEYYNDDDIGTFSYGYGTTKYY